MENSQDLCWFPGSDDSGTTEAFGELCSLGLGCPVPFSGQPQVPLSQRAWVDKLSPVGSSSPRSGALYTSLVEWSGAGPGAELHFGDRLFPKTRHLSEASL